MQRHFDCILLPAVGQTSHLVTTLQPCSALSIVASFDQRPATSAAMPTNCAALLQDSSLAFRSLRFYDIMQFDRTTNELCLQPRHQHIFRAF